MNGNNVNLSKSHEVLISVTSICLVLVELSGIICNSVILTIYYKYTRLRTATNLFILNLALCNLLLATLDIIFSAPSSFNREWQYGSSGCSAYGFGFLYLMAVEVSTLAIISFDRFCVITKPVRNLRPFVLTKQHARVLIVFIHVYSLAFTLPPLLGWNKLVPDVHFQTGCYINYSDQELLSLTYTLVSSLFTCLLPLILTSCCYAKIYRSVKSSTKRSTINKRAKHKVMVRGDSVPSLTKLKKISLTHTRTARMIAVVMFFFLLTWLPVKITGVCQAFGVHVPPLVVYVSVLLAKSCVMYNAVVYVFLNHRFRAAFLHLTFLCRDDSRLHLATSVTNQSGRFGDLGVSVTENYTNKTRVSKNLSQLSIIPNVGSSDVSLDLSNRGHVIGVPKPGTTSVTSTHGARVNRALQEVESGSNNNLSILEEQTASMPQGAPDDINRDHIRTFYHGSESSEVESGVYCQENNIVLGDQKKEDEIFQELNVNSLSNIGYV